MEQILIIDRNAVYELDEECFQRKMEAQRKQQEERANAEENDKSKAVEFFPKERRGMLPRLAEEISSKENFYRHIRIHYQIRRSREVIR